MRGYFDLLKYIYFKLSPERGVVILLSLVSLSYNFTGLWGDDFLGYTGVVLLGVSLWIFIRDLVKMQAVESYKSLDFVNELFEDNCIKPSLEELNDGFKVEKNYGIKALVLMSEKFNKILRDSEKDYTVEESKEENKRLLRILKAREYVMSPFIRRSGWLSFRRRKSFFNEKKIGVFSPIRSDVEKVKVSKIDYYSSFLTNELSTSIIRHKGGGKTFILYDGKVMFPKQGISKPYKILEFHSYTSGNHLGVSTIAITQDRFIVFWEQSSVAQQSENLIAPTGSGSLDWSDMKNAKSIKSLVIGGLEREFHEESNRKGIKIKRSQVEESLLLGYFRNLLRGGKPEFVALSRLSVSNTVLEPNTTEVEERVIPDRHQVDSMDQLKSLVDSYLNPEKKKALSVPLWVNLLALQQAIEENPDKIRAFCGIS